MARCGEEAARDSWNVAAGASPVGTYACPPTWHTDFREDLAKIDVPTLVMHGSGDRILPIEAALLEFLSTVGGEDGASPDDAAPTAAQIAAPARIWR